MAENPGTILTADDGEFLEELSEYLEILSHSTRLRILRLLEKKPLDTRSISMEIGISYENTKKHLERLLHAGLVTRRPGLGRETSRGIHPAWEYSPVPGIIPRIQRDLGFFSSLPPQLQGTSLQERITTARQRVSHEFGTLQNNLLVVGGEWDGRVVTLSSPCTALGRAEDGARLNMPEYEPVAFPESYRSLTRITRPHALVWIRDEKCLIEDRGSTGGTYINGKRIPDRHQVRVKDGDRITLSLGEFGVTLLFLEQVSQGVEKEA
ncbi:MAG: FHA domain-containing protein [Methanolinea sp.]|jgi:DNA-binding transcriptional ArsR family regulator|nr:FHA domain-containing protein [Methanolinea sp.]